MKRCGAGKRQRGGVPESVRLGRRGNGSRKGWIQAPEYGEAELEVERHVKGG